MLSNKTVQCARGLLLCALITVLTGCSGKDDVVSRDDSADYQSAVALPPLKKKSIPSPVAAGQPASPTVAGTADNALDKMDSSVTAEIVEAGSGKARLLVDRGFEIAWNYVSASLKRSNITVHNRNRSAGRFAIGCNDLDQESGSSKSRGWSIFNKKAAKQEYCALQLVATRKKTSVTVLNRSGNEIGAAAARSVFARLLAE